MENIQELNGTETEIESHAVDASFDDNDEEDIDSEDPVEMQLDFLEKLDVRTQVVANGLHVEANIFPNSVVVIDHHNEVVLIAAESHTAIEIDTAWIELKKQGYKVLVKYYDELDFYDSNEDSYSALYEILDYQYNYPAIMALKKD